MYMKMVISILQALMVIIIIVVVVLDSESQTPFRILPTFS